ncbi:ATP-binding protein [Candidatus Saccharibacteria bacterium]|nr:ATP-binding protein [Candidatus Saccharibacteria bacterium]MBI3337955.1 ATP-binding protein [Candidatus Saccharibacteria bacterium]
MVERFITDQVRKKLGKGRVIVLYGPRRIGKTTIARQLLKEVKPGDGLYLNCDELPIQQALESRSLQALNRTIGNAKRIVIDEAQRVSDIGVTLKLLIDSNPDLDIIATGSSSFELSNKVKEPLTGRSYEFVLEPLSLRELQRHFEYSPLDIAVAYERLMRFGGYPGIVLANDIEAAEEISLIAERYVYKDTLELVELRQRQLLPRLLTTLSLQIGQEVSYHEIGNLLGVKLETIERYITILESAFIIYRLPALTANKRGQISNRKRKVYFYDLGVRNALIENLNPLDLRDDSAGLWENFCMNERRKTLAERGESSKSYYWRGLYGEVDLVEQQPSSTRAFEFRLIDKPVRLPKTFQETYPEAVFQVIHKDNLADWLVFGDHASRA